MKFLFAILSGFVIFVASCKKDEPVPYYAMPAAVNEWAFYKPGSYWIYKNDSAYNDTTKITDSIYVVNAAINKEASVTVGYRTENYYDKANINYLSILDTTKSIVSYFAGPSKIFVELNEKNSLNNLKKYAIILAFNENLQLISYPDYPNTNSKMVFKNLHHNFALNNITYQKVAEVEFYYKDTLYYSFWIAQHNWIIKQMIYTQNSTISWSLLRSNIVQ